ncbi:probable phosphatase phospho2 isoform X6 [Diabrotica undecimpunctata]|uniref:probable phosphatase phospho2 isoform X6 n=2 Tax=Diabrotica undecimpunctata TaxID=50387 RepID=UPI003B642829
MQRPIRLIYSIFIVRTSVNINLLTTPARLLHQMEKKLAVFDFDHTIINDNSDVVAVGMLNPKSIPNDIKKLHRSDGWTAYMQGIFNLLHQTGIRENRIRKTMEALTEVQGMCRLIKDLSENLNYDVIVVSDSNSYFIESWLAVNKLQDNVLKVFTNPAKFNKDGLLVISMYHLQDTCKLSTKNMCKGQIVQDFITEMKKEGTNYEKVVYCGDGMNDFCPILRLNETDLACVRKGFKCEDIIRKSKEGTYKDASGITRVVNCEVFYWNNGDDILSFIKHF